MTTIISEVGHFTLPMKKRRNDTAVYRRRDSAASKKSEPVSGVCLLNGTLTERSERQSTVAGGRSRPPSLLLRILCYTPMKCNCNFVVACILLETSKIPK